MVNSTEALSPDEILTKRSPTEIVDQRNWWKIGFFVLAFLLLIVSAIFTYFLANTRQKEPEKPPTSSPTPIITPAPVAQLTPEKVLGEIKDKISKQFSVSGVGDANFNWLRDDNYAIRIVGKEVEVYESEEFTNINSEVETLLTLNGFVKNDSNSYSYDRFDTGPFIFTAAFENNQTKCLAEWRKGFEDPGGQQHDLFYKMSCGLYDQQGDPLNEIFPALKTRGLYTLKKTSGNYAIGDSGMFPCCGGAFWIAVKEDNQWKKIFEGQESPQCEVVDQYQIPQEIYENCFEDLAGELRFKTP